MKNHYVIRASARFVSLYRGSQMNRIIQIRENANLFFFITLRVKVVFVEDLGLISCNNRQHKVSIATNTMAVIRVVMST